MQVAGFTCDLERAVRAEPLFTLPPWQVMRIRRYVDEHLETSIRTEDLVALTSLSESYFFRAFKASFGTTPYAYIVARRVERAQKLLRTTNHSLSQIALDCGLNDQAHMSRLFRKETGLPPGAWRRCNPACVDAG